MKQAVVVGAGPGGLTAAVTLAEAGIRSVLVDRAPVVGGTCRSFTYGDYTFDVGVHCFGRCEGDVDAFVRRHCGDARVPVGSTAAASYFRGAFRADLGALRVRHLPLMTLARGMWDFLRRPMVTDARSLGAVSAAVYGRTFYEVLVKERVEQLTGRACEDVHVDFGKHFWIMPPTEGISFGVAVAKALRRLLGRSRPAPAADPYDAFYPTDGGFGEFAERLAGALRRAGGEIVTGAGIDRIHRADGRVTAVTVAGRTIPADALVWTGDLGSLLKLLEIPIDLATDAVYLVLFHFEVDGQRANDHLWVEFADPDSLIYRASANNLGRPRNAPAGCHGITAEVPCRVTDDVWKEPERLAAAVRDQLVQSGLVSADRIRGHHVERIPRAWPLYGLDYPERAADAIARIEEAASNVFLTNRPGVEARTVDRVIDRALAVAAEVRAAAAEPVYSATSA